MKLKYLMGIVGTGVLLGACGGFSDLGEGVGQGGDGSMDGGTGGGGAVSGSTAMGGSGAVGGSKMTGGSTGMTGGSNAMGGSDAVGGGTMTGGSTAMGGTNAMGGSSAVGGTSGTACMVPDDCPQPPPVCNMCLNGESACYFATCEAGVCGIVVPECAENIPCRGKACGDACMLLAPEDAEGAAAPAFPTACDAEGRCVDAGQALGCMTDPTPLCMTHGDCAAPSMMDCITCDDGSTSCPQALCIEGMCTIGAAACDLETACMSSADCPTLPPECLPCGDGCAQNLCLNGSCEVMCAIGRDCRTVMDCPSLPPDNVCTTGPWECVDETCSLRNSDCRVEM
jgi:hypothetical protein